MLQAHLVEFIDFLKILFTSVLIRFPKEAEKKHVFKTMLSLNFYDHKGFVSYDIVVILIYVHCCLNNF